MADIDLHGADAGRVRNQYRTSLGRDASDDEVSGWLTGSYGGGSLDDRLNQIAGSHEAKQRNPQPAPDVRTPGPDVNVAMTPTWPQANTPQQPGFGDPSAGYGPGGVNNAAYADPRAGIRNTYRQHLGRDASDAEIDKWLSGDFGYGTGAGAYDRYITAIMSSPEARAYKPQGNPNATNGNFTLEYWQSQGVPTIDIFDPMTGQLKPGWARTGKGYERTGAAGATGGAPGSGPKSKSQADIQPWFSTLTQGKRVSPKTLKEMEPMLAQYGIKLGPLNARGFTDGIILPDGTFVDVIIGATEDGGQQWGWLVGGGHGSGGPGGGGIGGVNLSSSQYSDPHTKMLEELMLARIGSLQSGNDAGLQRLMQFLEQRFNDLQGPGFTGAENEILRTQALDPIERDRAAARQRMLERLSARGITPDSGIAQQALQMIDNEFDGMRAQTQTAMASNEIQRREGRMQMAGSMASSLHDIPQSRAREALGYAGALSDLGPQRLQLAMQAAGMGGSPASNFASLMQLAQMNQNAALMNNQNNSGWLNMLGETAYYLSRAGR